MSDAKHDANRVPTLIGVSSVDGITPTLVEIIPSTGRAKVDALLAAGTNTIGAVKIEDFESGDQVIVTGDHALKVDGSGVTYTVTGTVAVSSSVNKYATNSIDDYSVASTTFIGKEDKDGSYIILKIDETGNFPLFTYATITNNPLLTTYTLAWAARTTATYNIYSVAM